MDDGCNVSAKGKTEYKTKHWAGMYKRTDKRQTEICLTINVDIYVSLKHLFKLSGQLQTLTKRLTIPHSSEEKQTKANNVEKNTSDKTIPEEKGIQSRGKITAEKNNVGQSRLKRSATGNVENKVTKPHVIHRHGNKATKRQFILTQPAVQPVQQSVVAYVPVVTSPQAESGTMTGQNLLLNMPEQTAGSFALNVPQSPRIYTPAKQFDQLYHEGQSNVIPEYQPKYVAMATEKSAIIPARGVLQGSNRVPLGELAGIMGTPIIRRGPPVSMFYNDQLPSNIEDEIFRDRSLQGRGIIPRRRFLGRNSLHRHFEDDYDGDDPATYSDDRTEPYGNSRSSEKIYDHGSYTERVLPDGRTVFRKDHVGFGPITVEANTAESALRHNDDAIDMNLDSDKRKQIPHPDNERVMDRRIAIPTPANK